MPQGCQLMFLLSVDADSKENENNVRQEVRQRPSLLDIL